MSARALRNVRYVGVLFILMVMMQISRDFISDTWLGGYMTGIVTLILWQAFRNTEDE